MSPKTISVEQLAMETGKMIRQARKRPIVVQAPGQTALVLRPLADDELAEELVLGHPEFRASIRRARRRREAKGGVALSEARRRLRA